jgi:hypothetical protein
MAALTSAPASLNAKAAASNARAAPVDQAVTIQRCRAGGEAEAIIGLTASRTDRGLVRLCPIELTRNLVEHSRELAEGRYVARDVRCGCG